jgi:hypothetical protein
MITAGTIDRITQFDSGGLPVVSVYLGLDADLRRDLRSMDIRLSSLLHDVRHLGKDSDLSREAKLSVRDDLERIEADLVAERPNPGAVAIFSCSGRDFYERIQLPRKVRDRIVVDETPWVRPMTAVLDEYHRTCVLVVDAKTAHTWELYQDEIRETGEIREARELLDQPRHQPNYGGWNGLDEDDTHNRTIELARRHFHRVAEVLDGFYRDGRFELLVMGGKDHEVPVFQEFLPHNLRGTVAGTFSIDPNTATIADIRISAEKIVESYERNEEQTWVAQVLERKAMGAPAAVGLEECLWAGSVAAIQRLLVENDATAPGVVCENSGWLAQAGDNCPVCGEPTRKADDVIDELSEAVIDAGGTVEHVYADTPLREHVLAADLRFPLPPLPGAGG